MELKSTKKRREKAFEYKDGKMSIEKTSEQKIK